VAKALADLHLREASIALEGAFVCDSTAGTLRGRRKAVCPGDTVVEYHVQHILLESLGRERKPDTLCNKGTSDGE
jgi:hypothetical protein